MKLCNRCKVVKDASEFHKHPYKDDGLQGLCKPCKYKYNVERRSNNLEKYLIMRARCRAKKKGLEFSISEDDIVIPAMCPILNRPFDPIGTYAPSIDRINPKLGYTKDNIQIISTRANTIKFDSTPEEIEQLYKFMVLTKEVLVSGKVEL